MRLKITKKCFDSGGFVLDPGHELDVEKVGNFYKSGSRLFPVACAELVCMRLIAKRANIVKLANLKDYNYQVSYTLVVDKGTTCSALIEGDLIRLFLHEEYIGKLEDYDVCFPPKEIS